MIYTGDCLKILPTLDGESVQAAVRNPKGQFVKGVRACPATEFKKGQHWRKPQPFREKEWLQEHYVHLQMSTGEIAAMFGVTDSAVIFWMQKHGIDRRTTSDTRKLKHWGSIGIDNPMWNRKGELNPNWKGGITAERQSFYVSQEWKEACAAVWKREEATCQRCHLFHGDSPDMPFHIHHIVPFSDKELRADPLNLALLCETCHQFVHSRRNAEMEYLKKGGPEYGDTDRRLLNDTSDVA